MAIEGSRSYPGYAAVLGLAATVMMGCMVAYANADDTRLPVLTAQKPQPPVATVTIELAKADVPEVIPEEAMLAPAAGTPAKQPARKSSAAKLNKLAPATEKSDNDELDDEYSSYDNDPLEPMNRVFFGFNRTVDGLLLRPATSIYRGIVPEEGRTAVTHFLDNLYAPVTLANSVLQGDPENSFSTLWRFILNTTFGICGIFDFASEVGLKNRTTDLGQTFAIYGGDSGPYFVIPLLGPSNVRDTLGRVGDTFLFPPNYSNEWAVPLSIGAAAAIDTRSNNMDVIDNIYDTSLDPYATFRSAYMQHRAEQVRRAKVARDKAQAKAFQ